MAAGPALALLSLPDTPRPDDDAPSAVLRAHHTPAATAVPAPAATSSQNSVPSSPAEAQDTAQAGAKQPPEHLQQQQQQQSSVTCAAGVATVLLVSLSVLVAWWLGTSGAAPWLSD